MLPNMVRPSSQASRDMGRTALLSATESEGLRLAFAIHYSRTNNA